jgi:class 3 adenylate cyclase
VAARDAHAVANIRPVTETTLRNLPTGTVTLLFTDIEGSTRLLQELDAAYAVVLDEYRRLLRDAVERWGGRVVDAPGDGALAVFPRAGDAVAAAQQALGKHPWPGGTAVRVRMGLHTGEPTLASGGYVGLDVHRAARLCAAAHGGQVLLSEATRALVELALPLGVSLRDLGEHRLKDLQRPERIAQLVIAGLPAEFPPLRTLERLSLPLTPSVSSALRFRPARSMMTGMITLILTGLLRVPRTRRALVLENLALRHQLTVLQRTAPRPRLWTSDRLLWVLLSHLWRGSAAAVSIVQPDTVIRWQRAGFTLFWTWKSRRSGPGRPSVSPEVRALIRRMSRANPLWGAPRLHGELQKLGLEVAQATVSKYLVRHRRRRPGARSSTTTSGAWSPWTSSPCPR